MSYVNIHETLAQHEVFKDLTPDFLQLIEQSASIRHFDHHDHLFYQGRRCAKFYLIVGGSVAIQLYAGEDGFVTLETVGPGELLGWSWLLPPYEWVFTGEAAESTDTIVFDGDFLRRKCDEDSRFGFEMAKRLMIISTQRLVKTRAALVANLCE